MTNTAEAELRQCYSKITEDIRLACEASGRLPSSVQLVAVGKKHPAWKIGTLAHLGHRDFAENYLQEALEKIAWCRENLPDTTLDWHFIGHIQSRKCRDIAENFHWVHTVESIKVANRLNQHNQGSPLNILIQVNIDDEETKSGVAPDQVLPLAVEITQLPNLNLRGLMIIPRAEPDVAAQRAVFHRCRDMLTTLQNALPGNAAQIDQLSMGMTADMPAAIAEGATMVRIGTALFGQRPTAV